MPIAARKKDLRFNIVCVSTGVVCVQAGSQSESIRSRERDLCPRIREASAVEWTSR